MPLDILYVGFVLGHGGDAAQMLELAAGMQARGKRVKAIVPELPTTVLFAEQGRMRGVDVERSALIRADPIAPRQVPGDLLTLFRSNPAELLHLHTGDVCLSRTVPHALSELNIFAQKVVVTVHSAFDTLVPGDDRAFAWSRAAGNRIRCIVCPSRHSMDTQLRYGVGAGFLRHIPNGVDLARYQNGDSVRIRRELRICLDQPLIVFTSRLDTQKRPLDALAAFIRIASDYPDCHLAFVGAGSLDAELRGMAETSRFSARIHLAGHRTDIADWLAAATIWVLPTAAENFSLAVLEALSAGCPIVSTMCRGNDEILVADQNALIHGVGDIDGLSLALRRLLDDPPLRTKLSANARQTSMKYGVDQMLDRYTDLYEGR
jgi:glycosyltransferase involved in cell wall biosynthesis